MQISKSYSGTVENPAVTSSREISWGVTSKQNLYTNLVDFVNQTVADFLHNDCGVDTVYEVREGSDYKFLWIYNVPFLFTPAAVSSYSMTYFYGPLSTTALSTGQYGSSSTYHSKLFAEIPTKANGGSYDFGLVFSGNPNTGFMLRFKYYSGTSIGQTFNFCFAKAKNLLNGKDAVVWKYRSSMSASPYFNEYMNGVDLNDDGSVAADSFSASVSAFSGILNTKEVLRTSNPGKLPLVPMIVGGIWRVDGIFQRPTNFNLPVANAATMEQQTEIQLSGRNFILAAIDAVNTNYMNFGLIEVSE